MVVAQLYGRPDHLDELQAVALEAGASYHEIVLMSDLASTLERFTQPGGARLEETLEARRGLDPIAELYERVVLPTRDRPHATVVAVCPGDLAATYEALIAVLGRQP